MYTVICPSLSDENKLSILSKDNSRPFPPFEVFPSGFFTISVEFTSIPSPNQKFMSDGLILTSSLSSLFTVSMNKLNHVSPGTAFMQGLSNTAIPRVSFISADMALSGFALNKVI